MNCECGDGRCHCDEKCASEVEQCIKELEALDEVDTEVDSDDGCSEDAKSDADLERENQILLDITRLLTRRLDEENCLCRGSRESISYRLAEIMVCAKDLYTQLLPRLIMDSSARSEIGGIGEGETQASSTAMFDEMSGARMMFLRMRDLIDDFDDFFMEAMDDQREADGNDEDWLRNVDWDGDQDNL